MAQLHSDEATADQSTTVADPFLPTFCQGLCDQPLRAAHPVSMWGGVNLIERLTSWPHLLCVQARCWSTFKGLIMHPNPRMVPAQNLQENSTEEGAAAQQCDFCRSLPAWSGIACSDFLLLHRLQQWANFCKQSCAWWKAEHSHMLGPCALQILVCCTADCAQCLSSQMMVMS